MWPSAQRIGKDIRASSQLFTRTATDVISEACFTAMAGYRRDELAAMDLNLIDFSSFLLYSVLFLNTELYTLYEC